MNISAEHEYLQTSVGNWWVSTFNGLVMMVVGPAMERTDKPVALYWVLTCDLHIKFDCFDFFQSWKRLSHQILSILRRNC